MRSPTQAYKNVVVLVIIIITTPRQKSRFEIFMHLHPTTRASRAFDAVFWAFCSSASRESKSLQLSSSSSSWKGQLWPYHDINGLKRTHKRASYSVPKISVKYLYLLRIYRKFSLVWNQYSICKDAYLETLKSDLSPIFEIFGIHNTFHSIKWH